MQNLPKPKEVLDFLKKNGIDPNNHGESDRMVKYNDRISIKLWGKNRITLYSKGLVGGIRL